MSWPKMIVFADGTKTGGGSGFENLVNSVAKRKLSASIVGVVSRHPYGGVREKADRLGIHFTHFNGPKTGREFERVVRARNAKWVALSGCLMLVPIRKVGFFWNILWFLGFIFAQEWNRGLDPRRTFNIHPGLLPQFGGKGMYGHHVHEATLAAYHRDEIPPYSAVTMHFVTRRYDEGPVFLRIYVKIDDDDTPDSLGQRVNNIEHRVQPTITDMVVNGLISWNGRDPKSLEVPNFYEIDRHQL